jgi:hypothetical protein
VSELQVLPSRASGRDRRHSRECLSGGSEWCARRYVVVRGGLCAAAGGASPRVDRRLEVTVVQRAGGHSLGDAGQVPSSARRGLQAAEHLPHPYAAALEVAAASWWPVAITERAVGGVLAWGRADGSAGASWVLPPMPRWRPGS